MPLENLAHAFAKFGTGHGLSPDRAGAAARLRAACAQKPWHVAGTGRFCTEIMQLFGARVFVKTGAEGVYCGALPSRGSASPSNAMTAPAARRRPHGGVIARFLPLERAERAALTRFVQPPLRNWNGIEIGGLRVTEAL